MCKSNQHGASCSQSHRLGSVVSTAMMAQGAQQQSIDDGGIDSNQLGSFGASS